MRFPAQVAGDHHALGVAGLPPGVGEVHETPGRGQPSGPIRSTTCLAVAEADRDVLDAALGGAARDQAHPLAAGLDAQDGRLGPNRGAAQDEVALAEAYLELVGTLAPQHLADGEIPRPGSLEHRYTGCSFFF